jgi:UDP-N-acetylenolpyruvoylglucosamine reductase
VAHIIQEVARAGLVPAADLLDRKTGLKTLRRTAMELSYRYSTQKQAEIGAVLDADYGTVSQNRTRLKVKLKSNRRRKKQFQQIKEQIVNLSILKI